MSLKIEQGLFNLDFADCHAILGVPIDADVKEVRKRYLAIARRLHPDSGAIQGEVDRQRANDLLSKLVNPAYEKLSQEKNATEYMVLLRLKGQQALKQQETVLLVSEGARKLVVASDVENTYRDALRQLGQQQYEQLDRTLEITGEISELNLVYLMRREGRGDAVGARRPVPGQTAAAAAAAAAQPAPSPARVTRDSIIASYLRRAQEFENKQDYSKAILELREAIRLEPTQSACHSRLGVIYYKTGQMTMAKIHFNKALELNPKDEVAREGKLRVESNKAAARPDAGRSTAAQTKPSQSKSNPAGKPKSNGKPDTGGGGLFGLFGGKKK